MSNYSTLPNMDFAKKSSCTNDIFLRYRLLYKAIMLHLTTVYSEHLSDFHGFIRQHVSNKQIVDHKI